MLPATFKTELKQRARELGFIACGVASAGASQTTSQLEKWLANGYEAGMKWMNRPESVEKRADIEQLFPGAKSVICVAFPYNTDVEWNVDEMGQVARYARGFDYHDTLKSRLNELLAWIQERTSCKGRAFVDTAPILEREWAQRAGLGWIGKNTLLMSRDFGSYVLLGELVVDEAIAPDSPHLEQFCGSCTRCMDACPTQAIVAPRELDANKCIAYHTMKTANWRRKTCVKSSAIGFLAAIFASRFARGIRKPSATACSARTGIMDARRNDRAGRMDARAARRIFSSVEGQPDQTRQTTWNAAQRGARTTQSQKKRRTLSSPLFDF
jgi:epoxyqueuosine reductase QueG